MKNMICGESWGEEISWNCGKIKISGNREEMGIWGMGNSRERIEENEYLASWRSNAKRENIEGRNRKTKP